MAGIRLKLTELGGDQCGCSPWSETLGAADGFDSLLVSGCLKGGENIWQELLPPGPALRIRYDLNMNSHVFLMTDSVQAMSFNRVRPWWVEDLPDTFEPVGCASVHLV